MVEIQQSRDVCIDILRTDAGRGLRLMSNLKSADQILKVMDGFLCSYLHSSFGVGETDELLLCSVGFNARGRQGIEEIGKAPEYNMSGWQTREGEL